MMSYRRFPRLICGFVNTTPRFPLLIYGFKGLSSPRRAGFAPVNNGIRRERMMKPTDWLEHVEQCVDSHRDDQAQQLTRALTLEFAQPLLQGFRRRRPRRRNAIV